MIRLNVGRLKREGKAMTKILWKSAVCYVSAGGLCAQGIINGGFEMVETITGTGTHPLSTTVPTCGYVPCTFGDWIGDGSLVTTNGTQGVATRTGNGMLQFLSTSLDRASGTGCDIWQSVDLSGEAEAIDQGGIIARVCAYVNRVEGGPTTDSAFILGLFASGGDVGNWVDIAVDGDWFLRTNEVFVTDSDPTTWERMTFSTVLPVGTRFVSLQLSAKENVRDNMSLPEFDGHFADDVSLDLFQAPVIKTSFGRGKLRFKVPDTNATYTVEWAHAPKGPYLSTWEPLREIHPEGDLVEVDVPSFFRVRGGEIPSCPNQ